MDSILLTKQELKLMLLNICPIGLSGSPCIESGFAKWYCATAIILPFFSGVQATSLGKGKIYVLSLMKDGNMTVHDTGCMEGMLFLTLVKRLLVHVMLLLLISKHRWEWFLKVLMRDHRLWTNTFRWPGMPVVDLMNIGMSFTSIHASWVEQSGIS